MKTLQVVIEKPLHSFHVGVVGDRKDSKMTGQTLSLRGMGLHVKVSPEL